MGYFLYLSKIITCVVDVELTHRPRTPKPTVQRSLVRAKKKKFQRNWDEILKKNENIM